MLEVDEDALICDLAETYHIYDMRGLPVSLLATLSFGLRDDSRIKVKLSGQTFTPIQTLIAAAVDRLSMILWTKTEDARKGRNRPHLLLDPKEEKDERTFDSPEDFEQARARIIERINKWQKEQT